jgi:putative transposase
LRPIPINRRRRPEAGTRVLRPGGATLLEQNDESVVQRRYMSLETLGAISDTGPVSLPAVAA